MGHKVLIGGTAYDITGGLTLVAGTGYKISGGRTLVGGTGYGISFLSAVLNDNAWDAIAAASSAGVAANYWSVGDRKEVTLNGAVGKFTFSNFSTCAFILGFNHNSTYEGTGRIHFQLAKTALSGGTDVCFTDSQYDNTVSTTGYFTMNSSNTNYGGWASSQMRSNILGTSLSSTSTFISALPAELRAVMKSTTKYTNNIGSSTVALAVTATTDYMFLLSEYETFGNSFYANTYESSKQAQYPYYSAGNSKVKYRHTATATRAFWYLRSPWAAGSTSFIDVDGDGSRQGDSFRSYGVAPVFCV